MALPTAEVVALWPRPNHINPETHGPANVIVELLLLSIASVILAIRLYTRSRISKGFGKDDVLIFIAYAPATTFVIIEVVAHHRLDRDRHTWDVRPHLAAPSLQVGLVEQILFATATGFTKLSILALIYRVVTAAPTPKSRNITRHIVVFTSVVVVLDAFVFIVVSLIQCRPLSDVWTITTEPQQCIDQGVHLLVASILNTVQDFVIVFLPIPTVLSLNLPLAQRATVILLFGGGFLVCIAGAVRTHLTWIFVTRQDGDINWYTYDMMLASAVELFLGITCASIPATKPFFALYLPCQRLGSSTEQRRRKKIHIYIIRDLDDDNKALYNPVQYQPEVSRLTYDNNRVRKPPANLNKPLPDLSSIFTIPFTVRL
ncbi:hypothetical protein QBC35DRAFT_553728 [Podospora australis]|uniref:Rhodopsin domain-containing protein n=1 Tax=Podospora australis TaxID=1536484 RepID=A0AAN6X1S4_9PEZI|nr:hypothetical protein QBC35DRAFT_553728 [Podospora australis]